MRPHLSNRLRPAQTAQGLASRTNSCQIARAGLGLCAFRLVDNSPRYWPKLREDPVAAQIHVRFADVCARRRFPAELYQPATSPAGGVPTFGRRHGSPDRSGRAASEWTGVCVISVICVTGPLFSTKTNDGRRYACVTAQRFASSLHFLLALAQHCLYSYGRGASDAKRRETTCTRCLGN
jgi:hypothetical protein